MSKLDFMTTCNEMRVPLDDFELQFCSRCFQVDCTRSLHGKSKFEQRTAMWEQRLFLEVPQMDESDPRFDQIRAHKFVSIDPGPIPEVGQSAWVDPRDLTETAAPEPEVDETTDEADTVGPSVPRPPERPPSVMMNTPNQAGQMVGDRAAPVKNPAPPKDPWEPKKSTDEPVVKPGAKIRFGGSGV